MGKNASNEDDPVGVVDVCDKAKPVLTDVEDGQPTDQVGAPKGLADIGEARPLRPVGGSVPVVESGSSVRMLLDEFGDPPLGDDVHLVPRNYIFSDREVNAKATALIRPRCPRKARTMTRTIPGESCLDCLL
jgi:hypothetical protein